MSHRARHAANDREATLAATVAAARAAAEDRVNPVSQRPPPREDPPPGLGVDANDRGPPPPPFQKGETIIQRQQRLRPAAPALVISGNDHRACPIRPAVSFIAFQRGARVARPQCWRSLKCECWGQCARRYADNWRRSGGVEPACSICRGPGLVIAMFDYAGEGPLASAMEIRRLRGSWRQRAQSDLKRRDARRFEAQEARRRLEEVDMERAPTQVQDGGAPREDRPVPLLQNGGSPLAPGPVFGEVPRNQVKNPLLDRLQRENRSRVAAVPGDESLQGARSTSAAPGADSLRAPKQRRTARMLRHDLNTFEHSAPLIATTERAVR